MITAESTGEILAVRQVIDPWKARELGDRVRSIFWRHVQDIGLEGKIPLGALKVDPTQHVSATRMRSLSSNYILMGQNDQATLSKVEGRMDKLMDERDWQGSLGMHTDFFIGTPGNGNWHIDNIRGFRLLVNLSRDPLSLLVAKQWNDTDFEEQSGVIQIKNGAGQDRFPYEVIEYHPGEGVFLSNFCETRERIPHAGVPANDKIIMRHTVAEMVSR